VVVDGEDEMLVFQESPSPRCANVEGSPRDHQNLNTDTTDATDNTDWDPSRVPQSGKRIRVFSQSVFIRCIRVIRVLSSLVPPENTTKAPCPHEPHTSSTLLLSDIVA